MPCESSCGDGAVGVVKTSSAITDVLLKSAVPVSRSSTGGSHLEANVWSTRGGSAEESLCREWLLWGLRGRAEVKRAVLGGGEGGGGGMVEGEWVRQGWDDHLFELLHVHTHEHTPLSNTLSHALRQTSPWLFTVLALIWAVTALTALIEKADCFCPGIRALRILRRYGAQRLERNLGLDLVVIRSFFLLASGELAYAEVRRCNLFWFFCPVEFALFLLTGKKTFEQVEMLTHCIITHPELLKVLCC